MATPVALRGPDARLGRGEGDGFHGHQWREAAGAGPVLMCDSYVMTAPTFPLHPRRHISAVAILFEDTVGALVSTDSVGTNHRSQMTSCAEATYSLRNCPGTQMDGDNDGIPCERPWCN